MRKYYDKQCEQKQSIHLVSAFLTAASKISR